MELLKVENLTVERGGKTVLENLNFSLHKGEKVFITGPNGSGKTTFVETIMGFIKPTKGDIYLFGRRVQSEEDFYKLRTTIGYVFQNPEHQLLSPTVEEELAFAPLNLGLPRPEVEERINIALSLFKIKHLRKKITFKLSGGEKRLVSIACVLTMEPLALILDEPTNDLDSEHFGGLLKFLEETEKALIVITHDERLMENLKTWPVYEMRNGNLKKKI